MSKDICIYYRGAGACADGRNCAFAKRGPGGATCKVSGRCGGVNRPNKKEFQINYNAADGRF